MSSKTMRTSAVRIPSLSPYMSRCHMLSGNRLLIALAIVSVSWEHAHESLERNPLGKNSTLRDVKVLRF